MKLKDFVKLALLSIVYFVITLIVMIILSIALGPFGHILSGSIAGIFTASVIYFTAFKVNKPLEFTIITIIIAIIMSLFHGADLIYLVIAIGTALLADLISYKNKSLVYLCISFGLMQLGQVLGRMLPVYLYTDKFRQSYVDKGYSAERMATIDKFIHYSTGSYLIFFIVLSVLCAIIGMIIARAILKKHIIASEK